MLEIGNRANILRPCLSTSKIPWWLLTENGIMRHVLKNKEQLCFLFFYGKAEVSILFTNTARPDPIHTCHPSWKLENSVRWALTMQSINTVAELLSKLSRKQSYQQWKEHHARNSPSTTNCHKEIFRKDQRVWFVVCWGKLYDLRPPLSTDAC